MALTGSSPRHSCTGSPLPFIMTCCRICSMYFMSRFNPMICGGAAEDSMPPSETPEGVTFSKVIVVFGFVIVLRMGLYACGMYRALRLSVWSRRMTLNKTATVDALESDSITPYHKQKPATL